MVTVRSSHGKILVLPKHTLLSVITREVLWSETAEDLSDDSYQQELKRRIWGCIKPTTQLVFCHMGYMSGSGAGGHPSIQLSLHHRYDVSCGIMLCVMSGLIITLIVPGAGVTP